MTVFQYHEHVGAAVIETGIAQIRLDGDFQAPGFRRGRQCAGYQQVNDFPKKPVYILGTGESVETPIVSQMYDMTYSTAFRVSSHQAFEEAGIKHEDVGHLMVYDAFAHLPIYGLEDLGFVKRGEAGAFIEEGNTSPGGKLPMNTSGGGLSYTHTGAYGMFLMQESIRQIRGEAAHQVSNVKVSFCQGVGGMFRAAGSLILTNEPPH